MKSCAITGCDRSYYSKSFCKFHYDKNRRRGNPVFVRRIEKGNPCPMPDCGKSIFSSGLCATHNRRLQRHGDPNFINPKCNRDGKTKERQAEYYAGWLKNNWQDQMAYRAARKARVRQATPPWADMEAIRIFYLNCPAGHHVDHYYPLHGKNVSGLHVIDNLQYLTAAENLKKSNKIP